MRRFHLFCPTRNHPLTPIRNPRANRPLSLFHYHQLCPTTNHAWSPARSRRANHLLSLRHCHQLCRARNHPPGPARSPLSYHAHSLPQCHHYLFPTRNHPCSPARSTQIQTNVLMIKKFMWIVQARFKQDQATRKLNHGSHLVVWD